MFIKHKKKVGAIKKVSNHAKEELFPFSPRSTFQLKAFPVAWSFSSSLRDQIRVVISAEH